ncbi:MAG: hypothetical protein ACK4F6_18205 [Hylemonella sp.]
MLTLFKNLISGPAPEEATPTAARLRMSLEERKAYRREILYQSVRESLLRLEALASMYKFKVMSMDERHHRFVVLIEVTHMFQARRGGKPIGFEEIEAIVKQRTFERCGVVVQGMFWRVDEHQASFSRERRAGDAPDTPLRPQTPIQRQVVQRYARAPYPQVSEREREQFAQAIHQGKQPPPMRVGGKEYASDLAPLEATAEVGGTQYGQL